MSFEVNWDLLSSDKALNESIRDFIDTQLQKIQLPRFIKDVKVNEFFIGKIPPSVIIKHIGDPFDEFYENDESDIEEVDNEDDSDTKASSISLNGKSNEKTYKDLQIIAEFDYRGDMYIEITTNLLLNYPSKSFVELPIKLKMTDLVVHSLVILSYAKKLVNFSFLCDITDDNQVENFINQKINNTNNNTNNNNEQQQQQPPLSPFINSNPGTRHNSNPMIPSFNSTNNIRSSSKDRIEIIKDIKIESEIGGGTYGNESNGSVLKNVGKVEKFLIEKLRSILRDELAWPGWISFDFSIEDDEVDEVDQELKSAVTP